VSLSTERAAAGDAAKGRKTMTAPQASPITLSLFDLYKIGPGPSSSHTIGPMRAGGHFRRALAALSAEELLRGERIEVRLYGSLSATGKGHGTDRAVLAGLLGFDPEQCEARVLEDLAEEPNKAHRIAAGNREFLFSLNDIRYEGTIHNFPWNNTLIIALRGGRGASEEAETILRHVYYSVGGGFLVVEGEEDPPRPAPPHLYRTMEEFCALLRRTNRSLSDLLLDNERALTGMDAAEVSHRLDRILDVMEAAVDLGLRTEGVLPGPIGLRRKAPILFRRSYSLQSDPNHAVVLLNAYALAAAEENAAGHVVVTAPTLGSSGVLPAVVTLMARQGRIPRELLRGGLLAAALVGFLVKTGASISGAEVGCQGEVGTASAMAAAFLAHVNGYPVSVLENAAEIALEHHLGMTCDPVGGYVQIPCIERNAMGAVKAYNAYLLASCGDPSAQKVQLDQVIRALAETGRDMSSRYKETAEGGLAVCFPQC